MALIPGLAVPAPEPVGARPGLFTAASGPLDLPTHGEGGGVRYVPVTCGTAYAYGITCYSGEVVSPDKPLDGDAAEVETGVFSVLSTLNCGAVGYTEAEARDKVRRTLESTEQGAVEAAFWTGEDYAGNEMGILNLEGTATAIFPPAAGVDLITTVLATLEDHAYRVEGYGYRAYVHAPVAFAPYAAEAGLVLPEGPGPNARKITPNGSIWVFGGGYPGTGAGGASGWPGGGFIHITGQTTVWRSSDMQIYQAFDQATNERLVVAERAYAVSYDCFNARAEFNPLDIS
jgi:hypothetical protein